MVVAVLSVLGMVVGARQRCWSQARAGRPGQAVLCVLLCSNQYFLLALCGFLT